MNKKGINENNKKLTITILSLIVLVAGIAYALVGAIINYGSANITASIDDRPIFVADASNQISLEIPYVNVESDVEYELTNATGNVNVSLTAAYTASCTYDLYWQWDETADTKNQYIKTSGAEKEYTISGSNRGQSFAEIQLNNYDANNLKTKLYSGVIVTQNFTQETWDITAHFYKTKAIQESHKGANYSGKIVVENVQCYSKLNTLSDTVLALESNDDYTSKEDGTIYRVANQNGVRYEGKNPDNYVEYNGELWRIIGTFNGSDMNLDPNKEYTKIARSTPIGNMAWDTGGENDWVKSTLNAYLNGEYLS